jgi:hypothetical protein
MGLVRKKIYYGFSIHIAGWDLYEKQASILIIRVEIYIDSYSSLKPHNSSNNNLSACYLN